MKNVMTSANTKITMNKYKFNSCIYCNKPLYFIGTDYVCVNKYCKNYSHLIVKKK